jgi:hypothetical protein
MFDETGASPHKCLARLPQQAQLSKTTAWRATKNLHLQLHKITQVQETEEGNYKTRQHTFVTGLCRQYMMVVSFTHNLHFSLIKLHSIGVGNQCSKQ